MPNKYPIYHRGEDGCNGILMFTIKKGIKNGDHVQAGDHIRIDGNKPKAGDEVICGTCGRLAVGLGVEWIDYASPHP